MLFALVLGLLMGSPVFGGDVAWAQELTKKSLEGAKKYRLDAQALVQNNQEKIKKCLIQRPLKQPAHRVPLTNDLKETIASNLYVFVSFSMPDAVLQALAREVTAIDGKLVFRGLIKGSFSATAEKLKTLHVEALIDPIAFRDHQITEVPTFVQGPNRLKGNVSVAYVLAQFAGENL